MAPDHGTEVLHGLDGPRIDVAVLEEVFGRAVAHARAHPFSFFGIDGYRLYCARGGEALVRRDLPDLPASFAVVGRHTQCDPQLEGDPEIALRHLVVRPSRRDDGTFALRFIELHAELPFHLLDDAPHHAISATGPVALRLGRHAVVALPFVNGRLVAVDELVSPFLHDELHPAPTTSGGATTNPTADITVLPSATGVLEVASRREPGEATFTISRDGVAASVGVRRADLHRGVLIGRLPRCLDGGIRDILSGEISRAHVLVLAEGERVMAFDLASTNGLFRGGLPVRAAHLRDEGTTLHLSRRHGVTFSYRREPVRG
jgi:hypothetical protein